jgi:phosphate transport system protein
MIRTAFERELQQLQDDVLRLGSEVEENVVKVVDALRRQDRNEARRLIQVDEWINQERITIGMNGLTLIATQQPLARDMRLIAAIIEIVGELERMHDYVKGIAKISLMLTAVHPPDEIMALISQMASRCRTMLRRSLQAFTEYNAILAREIPQADDEVDALYKEAFQAVIAFVANHPQHVEEASYLEWAAHNLERLADRVTNICEWVVYLVTGTYQEIRVNPD